MLKIILQECKNNSQHFTVQIPNKDFNEILRLIKEMPVRYYSPDDHLWQLPCRDLVSIRNKIQAYAPNIKYISDFDVIKNYKDYYIWTKEQLQLKKNLSKLNDGFLIDRLRQEMDADERMYPFQVIGSYFLYKAGNALLCDMVGLGKTVQSLTVIEKRFQNKEINFCIIICPSTLKKNWEQEIKKWTNSTSFVVTGNRAARKKQYKKAYKYDYMIINYDLLNYDMHVIDELILKKGYEYGLLVDEIQYTKNHIAKRSQHTAVISEFAKYRIGMSATAIENSLTDLYSIFLVVDTDVFGNKKLFYHFKEKFIKVDWFGNAIGYKDEATIKKRMAPYIIRRMKEDVLDQLPDKIENNYWVDLSPIQRKFYDEIKNNIVHSIKDMEKAAKIEFASILPMITYLRQAVLSAKLVGHSENISTKTDQLFDFLNSIDGDNKIVLFCHFVGMIELLKESLDKHKIKNTSISGARNSKLYCPINKRVDVVNEFNNNKDIKILVTSDILTEGVNITSANYLINFDLLFNPAKMEQRVGRIDRIGNKHKVINIINIIANDTIEQDVFETILSKKELSEDILDNKRKENRLTIKDIKNLLEIGK